MHSLIALIDYALLGLSTGGAYALVALGLVAVYHGTGVVNFAQGGIGMASAYAFWKLHAHAGVPLWPAIGLGIAAGVTVSIAFYAFVGRRLVGASTTTKTLVTLGLLLMLEAAVRIVWTNQQERVDSFLVSGGTTLFGAHVQYLALVLLGAAVALTVLLTLLFERTRFGHATTALQDSPLGAQALGYSPHPWGAAAWGISGLLAALAGILLSPITALSPNSLSSLVIPALGAALIAGFRRFGVALAVAVAAGVAESLAIGLSIEPGLGKSIPYLVTLVALVVSGRNLPGRGTFDTPRLFRVGSGRVSPFGLALGAATLAALVYTLPDYWSDTLALTAIFALIGLAVVVSTGYAGQVSLLPLGLAGASVLFAGWLGQHGAPFGATLAGTALAAGAAGFAIGLPSARLRGIGLTIATLAIAAILETWVFTSDRFVNGVQGWRIGDISLFGLSFDNALDPRRFALLAWGVTALAALAVAALRRSRAGRRILAMRSNERAAAACGVAVPHAKIAAFVLSAALAGLAGALLAAQSGTVGGQRFGEGYAWADSLAVLSMAVLSGAGYLFGGVLAGVFAPGGALAQLLSFGGTINDWVALVLALNLVFVLISEPDGVVAQILRGVAHLPDAWRKPIRALVQWPRVQHAQPTLDAHALRDSLSRAPTDADTHTAALEVEDLRVAYGDTVVVDGVSLRIAPGEVLGVLGANGAGKSSLVDALTGFVPARAGRVRMQGVDVTARAPQQRVAHGLTRTFQDHLLFDDLSVRENLETAAEPKDAWAWFAAPFGLAPRRSLQTVHAAAQVAGVVHHLDAAADTLSLGWQARVTLARALAARPRVLCLDEPAAALSPEARQHAIGVIRRAARELGVAILLVEHNIDVVLATCDAAIVMDAGRVIARGTPAEVLRLPAVRRAYLGDPLDADEIAEIETDQDIESNTQEQIRKGALA
ncbi:ABC transporter domain-containing protein [Paraburkholderia tropica]|uniref:ABC transporter permease subunit n=1 Tax=Paraburkholderia tropica TaxID=92647 RepID=UPI001CB54CBB|nr:ATP-binding cassette domain-containing protein [Paraburkholderia tropica]CAG9200030.1 ABC transporter domain-containing protein [Paraburkholderia tropica]